MTYHMWPQVLMLIVFVTITVTAFVRHGQMHSDPKINAYKTFWITMWFALVLGAGGFWDIR